MGYGDDGDGFDDDGDIDYGEAAEEDEVLDASPPHYHCTHHAHHTHHTPLSPYSHHTRHTPLSPHPTTLTTPRRTNWTHTSPTKMMRTVRSL
jgi:hypothetical protein